MRVVIVGGGYAGVACALRLARRTRGSQARVDIQLVNDGDTFIERIRLHQYVTGGRLVERSLRSLLDRAGVTLVIGRVDAIDTQNQSITVNGRALSWDRLVLAFGSRPRRLPEGSNILVPGETGPTAARLKELSTTGGRIIVIGGGLTGIELASEIAERHSGLDVTLFSRSPVTQGWSVQARAHVLSVVDRLGVRLMEGTEASGVGGDLPPVDLTFSTAGFDLPELAWAAGISVNGKGQVLVDPMLRSVSHPRVYAAGDCAATMLAPGDPLPMGCKSALPMGAQVGDNLAREVRGKEPEPFDFGLAFYCVSLGRRDGLIQWADGQGAPTGGILTGRRAAMFKELICRMTWHALHLESHGIPFMMGKRTGRAPRTLPADLSFEPTA